MIGAAAAALAFGCTGERREVPPRVADDLVAARVVDYLDRTTTTPGIAFRVAGLEDADLPDWRRGILEVTLGAQTQRAPFWVRRDGRYLIRGELVDLTVDPLTAVMRRIALDGQPSLGPADAAVTIVEYGDFQCPACASAFDMLERSVLAKHEGRVRFVFKHFPLATIRPWSEAAAVAAECAFLQGNDVFWALHRGIFTRQREITEETLAAIARGIVRDAGGDELAFQACWDTRATLEAVRADEREAIDLGVTSTPVFFVNGRLATGVQTAEAFDELIARAEREARERRRD